MKSLKNITAIVFALVLGAIVGSVAGFNPGISAIVSVVLFSIPKGLPVGGYFGVGGLEVEVWKNWIVEPLLPQNPWLDKCRNADEFVQQGKYVIIPQAGAASAIAKNRDSLPATIKKKQDTHIFYGLDEFTSDPVLIEDIETVQLSYNKMQTHMGIDRQAIVGSMAENILYKWAAGINSSNVIPTTGANTASHLSGTTGTQRKAFGLDDLANLKDLFSHQDVTPDGWMLFCDSQMYKQLVSSLKVSDYRDFSSAFDKATGKIVGKLFNFEIIERSRLLRRNTTIVADPYSLVAAADDNAIAVAVHPMWVERALGDVKVFEDYGKPEYYGDVFSMLGRSGGRRISKDDIGVGIVSQAAV
jgi:hypothetical protein